MWFFCNAPGNAPSLLPLPHRFFICQDLIQRRTKVQTTKGKIVVGVPSATHGEECLMIVVCCNTFGLPGGVSPDRPIRRAIVCYCENKAAISNVAFTSVQKVEKAQGP
jgi:hypothetical protein